MSYFLPGNFSAKAKSMALQISVVVLIFLLFPDKISRGQKSFEGVGETASVEHTAHPPVVKSQMF